MPLTGKPARLRVKQTQNRGVCWNSGTPASVRHRSLCLWKFQLPAETSWNWIRNLLIGSNQTSCLSSQTHEGKSPSGFPASGQSLGFHQFCIYLSRIWGQTITLPPPCLTLRSHRTRFVWHGICVGRPSSVSLLATCPKMCSQAYRPGRVWEELPAVVFLGTFQCREHSSWFHQKQQVEISWGYKAAHTITLPPPCLTPKALVFVQMLWIPFFRKVPLGFLDSLATYSCKGSSLTSNGEMFLNLIFFFFCLNEIKNNAASKHFTVLLSISEPQRTEMCFEGFFFSSFNSLLKIDPQTFPCRSSSHLNFHRFKSRDTFREQTQEFVILFKNYNPDRNVSTVVNIKIWFFLDSLKLH